MAKGPKGEYRPADPLKAGRLVMRIAVGDLTETEAQSLAKKSKTKRKQKTKRPKPG